ncbi:dTDP-4-dehydrorhamnose reductase [Corynebacterium guangdongense]|uniref:dTDP-4-dehydrorhamnose reductase n=1 Tax=Corynebacterium guangdongense TaxID=1783348 RepID=A0ABU1ZY66_9CORY|nr:dTDP-4-dehydrorhamnose reductase [Corynebacterium guangdongense]MDR7329879.1 dTDP-4-dehydrorhamnose 3,5-epimerase [Corynebacterium guangdongense]WJZ18442.1 dTDP-4-dehydrorhamnose reductase [Corynebacterium guangdongense]
MIEGLKIIDLAVHEDARGWFKENWRGDWLDFTPVQQNVSFNAAKGTTRGLHAEPWDKLVSVAHGRVFGAWHDLREGSPTFGETVTHEFGPEAAVFVPRGVANGFQALADDTVYTYLVGDYWSAQAQYANISLSLVDWPLQPVHVSAKDAATPATAEAVAPRRVLVTGADGQLGTALKALLPDAEFCSRADFDITDPPARPWRQYAAIINAAAYNDVDGAEDDRARAWAVNATGPARLARIAAEHDLTLVHVSSDYVFDGTKDGAYTEEDPVSPLSLYGASKAAGDTAAATAPKHYVVRTSWVVGAGGNFVRTMMKLAERGVEPRVVDDQRGRPTFVEDLAKGIVHLLTERPEYGVYNVSNSGDEITWFDLASATYQLVGAEGLEVTPVSTEEYAAGRPQAIRPKNSIFDLSKIKETGFTPADWRRSLETYIGGSAD